MCKSSLRHIHDSVLLSLKVEVICCSVLLPSLPSPFPRPHTCIGSESRLSLREGSTAQAAMTSLRVSLERTSPKTYTCQKTSCFWGHSNHVQIALPRLPVRDRVYHSPSSFIATVLASLYSLGMCLPSDYE